MTVRGTNFTSALIKETCKLLKIHKLQTSSYHPQANGICERMHKLLIDMLSHFVRKDARNWDDYVPYAVMAYRAMPHCSTKCSPYYLVFGRDMRLPIEDDWRPKVTKPCIEGDYEEHVKTLALRLREANEAAGKHSKQSHLSSKEYYDRRTRLEQFRKGDLVYLYDPAYKRGKSRKFEYQYKGTYEVEAKVSPLIYRIRKGDGSLVVVHLNRLKRTHVLGPEAIPSASVPLKQKTKSRRRNKLVSFDYGEEIHSDEDNKFQIRSRTQMGNDEIRSDVEEENTSEETDSPSSVRRGQYEPDWDPGS